MNAVAVRALSAPDLWTLYDGLRATRLPEGDFAGRAWSHDLGVISLLNSCWKGKRFEGHSVWNIVKGLEVIEGRVSLDGNRVVITYPQLGLTDTLKPVDDRLWLGRMQLGTSVLWFTLEKE